MFSGMFHTFPIDVTGIVRWMFTGMFQYLFTFASSGVQCGAPTDLLTLIAGPGIVPVDRMDQVVSDFNVLCSKAPLTVAGDPFDHVSRCISNNNVILIPGIVALRCYVTLHNITRSMAHSCSCRVASMCTLYVHA